MLYIKVAMVAVILFPLFSAAANQNSKACPSSSKFSSSECGCGDRCAPGVPGVPGNNGFNGARGPVGPKGEPGDQGPKGIQGLPAPSRQWKQCVYPDLNDDRSYGLIESCTFQKNLSSTGLRVFWNGAFRIRACNACCKRWYFSFNGVECAGPHAIDGVIYLANGKLPAQSVLRVRHIEGVCENIPAGLVEVGFNIGDCSGYGNAPSKTGWRSVSRLYIEEVPPPQQ